MPPGAVITSQTKGVFLFFLFFSFPLLSGQSSPASFSPAPLTFQMKFQHHCLLASLSSLVRQERPGFWLFGSQFLKEQLMQNPLQLPIGLGTTHRVPLLVWRSLCSAWLSSRSPAHRAGLLTATSGSQVPGWEVSQPVGHL